MDYFRTKFKHAGHFLIVSMVIGGMGVLWLFKPIAQPPFSWNLEIVMASDVASTAQAFFDNGRGFCEDDSRRANVKGANLFDTLNFDIPASSMKQLRFDPLERAGTVRIAGARLSSKGSKQSIVIPIDAFEPLTQFKPGKREGGAAVFTTIENAKDPNLSINIPLPLETVKISLMDRFRSNPIMLFGVLISLAFAILIVFSQSHVVADLSKRIAVFGKNSNDYILRLEEKLNITHSSTVSLFVLFLAAGIGALGTTAFLSYLGGSHVDLVIDAEIYANDYIETYVNQDWGNPHRNNITFGKRTKYIVRDLPGTISSLRIDPTNTEHAMVILYGLELRSDAGVLKTISGDELKQWGIVGAEIRGDTIPYACVLSTNSDPRLQKTLDLSLTPRIVSISPMALAQKGLLIVIIVMLSGFSILSNPAHRMIRLLAASLAIAGGYFIIRMIISGAQWWPGIIPPVTQGIGKSSYYGISKQTELFSFWAAIGGLIFITVLITILGKAIHRSFEHKPLAPYQEMLPADFSKLFYFFVLAVFGFFALPDYSLLFCNIDTVVHPAHYDAQNFITWQYLFYIDKIPFRDFWYPYSGFFFAGLGTNYPNLTTLFINYLHTIIYFGIFSFCLYRFLDYRKLWTLCILGCILFLHSLRVFDRLDRYFLSLDFFLLFAYALDKRTRLPWVLWGLFGFYVFWMEFVQMGYATVSCVLLFVIVLSQIPDRSSRRTLYRSMAGGVLVMIVPMIAVAGLLYRIGALHEFIRFYLTMQDTAIYSMSPAPMMEWLAIPFTPGSWLFILLVLLFGFSLWHALRLQMKKCSVADLVPFFISVLGIVAFQKQLLRPHIAVALMSIPVTGIFILVYRLTRRARVAAWGSVWLALGVGVVAVLLYAGDSFYYGQSSFKRLATKASLFPHDMSMAFNHSRDWQEKEKDYFQPRTFIFDKKNGEDLRSEIQQKLSIRTDDNIFVFGDDPFLYILLGKPIPFYITLYNQSLLSSQQQTVEWMERRSPRYIFWRTSFASFDDVPNNVRVPILYNFIVMNYTYESTIDDFTILRKRMPNEKIDFSFWKKAMTPVIDLGFIPGRSEMVRYANQPSPLGIQKEYLTITMNNPVQGQQVEVQCECGKDIFTIRFRERGGVNDYHIQLNRIWFYAAARADGLTPKFYLLHNENINQRILQVNLAKDILY